MNPAQNSKASHNPGWVYVIDNQSMPEMVKVGYTNRHPEERLQDRDYSVGTGMPTPYRVAFAMKVDNAREVEHAAHQRLPGRVTQPGVKGNEWFRCGAIEAIKIAAKTAVEQHKPIWEYYNPHKMDVSGLPALAGANQSWIHNALRLSLGIIPAVLAAKSRVHTILGIILAVLAVLAATGWLIWESYFSGKAAWPTISAVTGWLVNAILGIPGLLWQAVEFLKTYPIILLILGLAIFLWFTTKWVIKRIN